MAPTSELPTFVGETWITGPLEVSNWNGALSSNAVWAKMCRTSAAESTPWCPVMRLTPGRSLVAAPADHWSGKRSSKCPV